MKELITKNKWFGFVAVVLYALISAFYTVDVVVPFVKEYLPAVTEEAEQFLPITIENNEIVEPANTIISKTYGSGSSEAKVVLDTRVDEFETSALTTQGLYISRKFIYGVSRQKTEIRSLESMKLPNMVISSDVVKSWAAAIEKNVGKYIFGAVFAFMFLFTCAAILLYTVCSHWIVAIWFKQPFSQTLFINTIAYIAIGLLHIFVAFSMGVIVTFVALIAVNVGVCSSIRNDETPAA